MEPYTCPVEIPSREIFQKLCDGFAPWLDYMSGPSWSCDELYADYLRDLFRGDSSLGIDLAELTAMDPSRIRELMGPVPRNSVCAMTEDAACRILG
jgi:hypothetical protein